MSVAALQECGTSLVQELKKEETSNRRPLADVWSQDSNIVTETSKNILSTTCASENIRVQSSNMYREEV